MKLFLIRHGKTKGNTERRFMGGRTEDSLSPEGKAALRTLPDVPEDAWVFVSPMRRAIETAEILFPDRPKIPIENFRELDFGRFENKTHEEMQDWPEYQAWVKSGGEGPVPEGEQLADFSERTWSGLQDALEHLRSEQSKTGYIVAHGGTIMAILSRLTGKHYYDFLCENGEGYVLTWDERILQGENQEDAIYTCTYHRFCGGVSAGSDPG